MIGFVRAILLAILVRIIVGSVAALASYTALSSALPHRAAPPSLRDTIAAVRAGLSEIDRVWPGLAHPRAPVSASRGPFRLRGVRLESPGDSGSSTWRDAANSNCDTTRSPQF